MLYEMNLCSTSSVYSTSLSFLEFEKLLQDLVRGLSESTSLTYNNASSAYMYVAICGDRFDRSSGEHRNRWVMIWVLRRIFNLRTNVSIWTKLHQKNCLDLNKPFEWEKSVFGHVVEFINKIWFWPKLAILTS